MTVGHFMSRYFISIRVWSIGYVYLRAVLSEPPSDKRNRLHTFVLYRPAVRSPGTNDSQMKYQEIVYESPAAEVVEIEVEQAVFTGSEKFNLYDWVEGADEGGSAE